jgi:hypothetical protein
LFSGFRGTVQRRSSKTNRTAVSRLTSLSATVQPVKPLTVTWPGAWDACHTAGAFPMMAAILCPHSGGVNLSHRLLAQWRGPIVHGIYVFSGLGGHYGAKEVVASPPPETSCIRRIESSWALRKPDSAGDTKANRQGWIHANPGSANGVRWCATFRSLSLH